jgi:hypothetical protein
MTNEIKIEFTFKNVPQYVIDILNKAEIKIVSGNIDIDYNTAIHNETFASIGSIYKVYEMEQNGTLEQEVQKMAKECLQEAREQVAQIVKQYQQQN